MSKNGRWKEPLPDPMPEIPSVITFGCRDKALLVLIAIILIIAISLAVTGHPWW